MEWRPKHKTHSIVRVRILIQLNEKLPFSKLEKISGPIVENFKKFGFEENLRERNIIIANPTNQNDVFASSEYVINGWVLNRYSENQICEVAGFRDNEFGYMSYEYGRWRNLLHRFVEIFKMPLIDTLKIVDIGRIRLEYIDEFYFDGDHKNAEISKIIEFNDPIFPESVQTGEFLWNSHVGWFETISNFDTFIQRNIEERNEKIGGNLQRVLNIVSSVDLKPESVKSIKNINELLTLMHKRSILVFGKTLNSTMREKMGIKIEEYED